MEAQTLFALVMTALTLIGMFYGLVKLGALFWKSYNKTAKVMLFFGVAYLVFAI